MRLSIRTKFTLAFFSLILIGSIAVLTHQYFRTVGMTLVEWDTFIISTIDDVEAAMLRELHGVTDDLLVLRDNIDLRAMLDSVSEDEEDRFRRHALSAFLSFARIKKRYDQIRYIDDTGMERLRVNYNGRVAWSVPGGDLQDKHRRYYFNDILNLEAGSIYLSPIDLNIERGKIEEPYKPVLRYGMTVFDSGNRKRGIVTINYLADAFLEKIRHRQTALKNTDIMLVNKDGYFLLNPDPDREWSFMFSGEEKFQKYYPSVSAEILSGGPGSVRGNGLEFNYRPVYPLRGLEKFVSSTGSPEAFTPSREYITAEDYYWVVVLSTPVSAIDAPLSDIRARFIATSLAFLLAGFLVAYLLSARMSKAIIDLQETVRSIDLRRKPPLKAKVLSNDEIGDLAVTFNEMAHELSILIDKEKELAACEAVAAAEKEKVAACEKAYTELREMQERLVRSEKLAVLGELASVVSHELRNPLGVIRNSIYFLRMKLGSALKDEKIKKHLDIADEEINASDRIISDILTFGRMREPEFTENDINDLIKKSMEMVEVLKNVRVHFRLGRDLPPVMADDVQLIHTFSNIIANAIQAMHGGGELTITSRLKDGFVETEFADTGEGIPPENMKRIFDPLFTTKAKGTGLGLSICQSIIRSHRGGIAIQSEAGKGTTVTVRFPVANPGKCEL